MVSGYKILQEYNSNPLNKEPKVDTNAKTLDSPFTLKKDLGGNIDLLSPKEIGFINTSELSKTAKHFQKYGKYTNAHPIYDKREFTEFWDREEDKRKNGVTVPGELYKENGIWKIKNIHITGQHYGYLNFAQIKRVDTISTSSGLVSVDGEPLTKRKASGSKIIEFPDFWDGDYYFFKAVEIAKRLGKHLVVGKARRKGYSYKNGWISADRADLYRNTVTLLAAYNSDTLYPEGTMGMANSYLQFIAKHTDWAKRRLIDRENFIKFGFRRNDGLGIEEGYLSRIIALAMSPANAGVARGKDADLVLVEEAGKNPILSEFLASTLPTLRAGAITTGLMIVFGTGGGGTKLWEGFEKLFYLPDTLGFLAFENIYDDGTDSTQCGFFIPSYINKEAFIDEYGNSVIDGAVSYENEMRDRFKNANDMEGLAQYTAEEPFNPREAFARAGSTIFDTAKFNVQIKRVENEPDIKGLMRVGNIVRTNKGLIFKDREFATKEEINSKEFREPIIDFPVPKVGDKRGSLVLWDLPHRIDGIVPENLYRIWHDPYALNKDAKELKSSDSMGVFLIYERTNNLTPSKGDRIIGKYIGRFDDTESFNDILFDTAEFFNAKIQFERNRGDVYTYARQKGKIDILADDPSILKQSTYDIPSKNPKKGIYITTQMKAKGIIYVKDWFNRIRGVDDFGNEILNLHTYYDKGGLKEATKWNFDGNFDTMSTLIIGMFDEKQEYFSEIKIPKRRNLGESNLSIFERNWF